MLTSYQTNPNLQQLVVETSSGKKEYRSLCKKIKNKYYIINEDCFFVDGLWYRKDSGLIFFDHENNNWVKDSQNLIRGIVDFDNGVIIRGYFTPNLCKNVNVIDSVTPNEIVCISETVALKFSKEIPSSGRYLLNFSQVSSSVFSIKNILDHKKQGYNIEDNEQEMLKKIYEYNTNNLKINNQVKRFSALLGDITFGLEFEVIAGFLPPHIQYQTGTVVCRDGSLHASDGTQGPEFTTIPLSGAKGLQSTILLCKSLTNRTIIDNQCSLHLHIGNIKLDRLLLVSTYKLAYSIQDEMFKLFPFFKTNERELAGKDKDYCKKLSAINRFKLSANKKQIYENYINDGYTRIFKLLCNGNTPSKEFNRKNKHHPKPNKWERVGRYYWINFMNAIFSKRNTLEFRLHNATRNPEKVIAWIFLCNAIIKTASLYSNNILKGRKFSLEEVANYYKDFFKSTTGTMMSEWLNHYIIARKEQFQNDFEKGDFLSKGDLINDSSFTLYHSVISKMF